jgi:hypothetical protein
MRDNGVPNFPDPVNGGLQINGNEVGMDTPAFKAADEACKSLIPAPPAGQDDQEDRDQMLAYAQCMRDSGVPNFPDPKPGEGINIDGDVLDLNSPAFKAAEQACASLGPGGPGASPVTNSQ